MIKENVYLFLSIWLSVIGAFAAFFGKSLVVIGGWIKNAGVSLIEYSMKYDLYQ